MGNEMDNDTVAILLPMNDGYDWTVLGIAPKFEAFAMIEDKAPSLGFVRVGNTNVYRHREHPADRWVGWWTTVDRVRDEIKLRERTGRECMANNLRAALTLATR